MSPEFLPFHKPSIGTAEREAVLSVLDSGWLTTGPQAREFEESFAEYVGSRYAVALNSATAALHLALEALGVGPGDEVVVPTWTFAAGAEVVVHLGARPVLVDVDPVTLNATPETIRAGVGPLTRAVIAVHFAGNPAGIEDIVSQVFAPVVEDAAHALPSRLPDGRFAGTIGRVGAFSFYATKTITSGEGGMLVTDDQAIAERARVMSLHGIANAHDRYAKGGSWEYAIEAAGWKYNMTDIAAALGLVQLTRADELHAARRYLADRYSRALAGLSELIELPVDDPAHAWHLYVIRLRTERLAIDRRAVIEALKECGIGASIHFIPLHLHPYYRSRWDPREFPVATREAERVISLPLWPGMTDEHVDRVVSALRAILVPASRKVTA